MVECGGLENRCTLAGTEGSNPSLSAKTLFADVLMRPTNPYSIWHSLANLFASGRLRSPEAARSVWVLVWVLLWRGKPES